MKNLIKDSVSGFKTLVVGMRLTIDQFFRRPVTVHYPREALKMPERYRGHIELVRDPETGNSLCIACKSCEKACPSDCIFVEGIKREGEKRKSPTEFSLDFTKCSLCGSCVEVCPTDALRFTKEYNLASTERSAYLYDLLRRLEGQKK
ncbi:MAG TPA: NADH-quinone oxidoreductase subunit I [Verrucomicrobiae bacterium]|nr:NADH-quinone oxidoreductase subunit I [Verrucomicrobiae bacterium]